MQAFTRSPEFREFAFPLKIAPPLMTRYQSGMSYGAHADAAFIQIGSTLIRSDLSCTVFLNDPASYEGGALHVRLGDSSLRFKLQPGEAIIYPSDTFHEVEPVTKGERLVAITFIESQVSDPFRRNLLFDLNEVAALEGLNMASENFSRLQLVQQCLLRHWADKP
jgi:PKHD-type hydroxylase